MILLPWMISYLDQKFAKVIAIVIEFSTEALALKQFKLHGADGILVIGNFLLPTS